MKKHFVIAILLILAINMGLASISMGAKQLTTLSASAENTFSDPVAIHGKFNISLSGTWSGTVHLQRSFDNGSTWMDVGEYTENAELSGDEVEDSVLYRIGVKSGNYVSGTVVGRISQ